MKKYLLPTMLVSFVIMLIVHIIAGTIPKSSPLALLVIVTVVVLIAAPIVLAMLAYRALRQRKVGTEAYKTTVIGVTVGMIVGDSIGIMLNPISDPINAIIIDAVVTFLLCWAGTAVAARLYRNKHSIVTG